MEFDVGMINIFRREAYMLEQPRFARERKLEEMQDDNLRPVLPNYT